MHNPRARAVLLCAACSYGNFKLARSGAAAAIMANKRRGPSHEKCTSTMCLTHAASHPGACVATDACEGVAIAREDFRWMRTDMPPPLGGPVMTCRPLCSVGRHTAHRCDRGTGALPTSPTEQTRRLVGMCWPTRHGHPVARLTWPSHIADWLGDVATGRGHPVVGHPVAGLRRPSKLLAQNGHLPVGRRLRHARPPLRWMEIRRMEARRVQTKTISVAENKQ